MMTKREALKAITEARIVSVRVIVTRDDFDFVEVPKTKARALVNAREDDAEIYCCWFGGKFELGIG